MLTKYISYYDRSTLFVNQKFPKSNFINGSALSGNGTTLFKKNPPNEYRVAVGGGIENPFKEFYSLKFEYYFLERELEKQVE